MTVPLPPFARTTLLHNPRCSKSRAAKLWLDEQHVDYEERRYLEEPLDAGELAELRKRLDRPAREWVRSGEAEYAQAGLGPGSDDKAILAAMAAHPILIERPILVVGRHAAVGRPLEKIQELISEEE
jgi:arsenate reductase